MDKMLLGRKIKGKVAGGGIGFPLLPISPKAGATIINPFILPGSTTLTPIYFGNKNYELSDWLGNVRVVINDRKTPVNTGNVTVSYMPQVLSVSDYYSFGSEIFERTYSHNVYRFGFNGKEDLHEQRWYQDYGARFYNKALGRFVSADPLIVKQKHYSWLSSYQFASNTPIWGIDRDGLEVAYKNQQGFWTTAGDNLQHNPNAEEVKMMNLSRKLTGNPSGIWKGLDIKVTAVLTHAQNGFSFQTSIFNIKFGMVDVSNERDVIGIRDNEFVKNKNMVGENFNLGLGLFNFGIKKISNKTEYSFGTAFLEVEKQDNETELNIIPSEKFNIKFSLPIIGLGIETGIKISTRSDDETILKNKNTQKILEKLMI